MAHLTILLAAQELVRIGVDLGRTKIEFINAFRAVQLEAGQISATLDALKTSTDRIRTVIVPGGR